MTEEAVRARIEAKRAAEAADHAEWARRAAMVRDAQRRLGRALRRDELERLFTPIPEPDPQADDTGDPT